MRYAAFTILFFMAAMGLTGCIFIMHSSDVKIDGVSMDTPIKGI
jgi:hypothetical protein